MSYETERLQEEWDKKFETLEEEYDRFEKYFDENRKCKCKDVTDCRHFDRAIKIFDKKLDELDDLNLKIFGRVYQETIKPHLD